MLKIHNLIIHNILKKQFEKDVILKERQTEIVVGPKHEVFFEKILSIYYKKSNPAYGTFDGNITSYPFQTILSNFLAKSISFHEFTIKSLQHFTSKIKEETNATGGFFLIAYFTSQNQEFLATITLNNTTNYDIDEASLDIIEKMILDIEKVDVANIVNINKWKAKEKTYLTFTKGRKDISEYFISFIGCTQLTDSKHFSQQLKSAFNDYLISESLSEDDKISRRMCLFEYLSQKTKERTEISIDEIANNLFPEKPTEFKDFILQEKYGITPAFRCDINTFKDYQYVYFKGKDLNFKFHRNLLFNQTISYNKTEKSLTIKNLDQSVIDQIEQIGT
ncbi:MAG: nucleoid-associated protein [Bacteroidetes bacterium]|nr:nucleoid-associated protein [Bacteroidota bacterium]